MGLLLVAANGVTYGRSTKIRGSATLLATRRRRMLSGNTVTHAMKKIKDVDLMNAKLEVTLSENTGGEEGDVLRVADERQEAMEENDSNDKCKRKRI